MTFKTSTGLRNKMLDTSDLTTTMAAGFIRIFSGAVPATADAAETGTLLCIISIASGGTGINFDPAGAASGVIAKNPGEVWSGVNVATNTATYYRHVGAADTAALSTTEPRIQGAVGVVGSELNLSSVALVSAATQTIDFYSVALPTL